MTGGTVVLAGNDSFSGNITVQGHKNNDGTGEMTLALGRDMTATGTIAVKKGGTLDVAGYQLTVNQSLSDNGGVLADSVGTGALVFDTSAGNLSSTATLTMDTVRKTGGNTLVLGGNNTMRQFYVDKGTLQIGSDNALADESIIYLASGTTLDNKSHAMNANVALASGEARLISSNHTYVTLRGYVSLGDNSRFNLANETTKTYESIVVQGGAVLGQGSTLAMGSNSKRVTLNGDVSMGAGSSITLGGDKTTTVSMGGDVSLSEDCTLVLGGADTTSYIFGGNLEMNEGRGIAFNDNSTVTLKGETTGGTNTSLSMNGGTLNLGRGSAMDINGSLNLSGDVTMHSAGSANAMARNIQHLNIGGGKLTMTEASWSTVWNIDSLSGSGEIEWNSTTTHETTSRLILKGDGGFSGSIELNRQFEKDARTHGAFIELASDTVAKNATIDLTGKSATSVASLAVNTDNARIKGLAGNEHSYVYAGASMADAALSGTNRPATTRAASLTVDVEANANYTYSGTLGNSSDTAANGLSLVKTGEGTQEFTGTTTVANVTVNQGSLNLSTADIKGDVTVTQGTLGLGSATIGGDINLHTGATLNKSELQLGAGQALHVKAGSSGTTASIGGNLVLNGGSLNFESEALSADAVALAVTGSVSYASEVSAQTVTLDSYRNLTAGTTYTLASGDWSGVTSDSVTINNLGYFTATASTDADGLQMTIGMADNVRVWEGKSTSWNKSNVDSLGTELASNAIVVFDNTGSHNSTLSVKHWQTIAEIIVNSDADYSFTSHSNLEAYVAKVGKLTIVGDGTTTLHSGINVTGATVIDDGRLILKSAGNSNVTQWLQGEVCGTGTLEVDWGSGTTGTLNLGDLENLVVTSGTLQTASTAMNDSASITVAAGAELQYTAETKGRVSPNHYGEGAVSLKMTGGSDGYSNKLNLGEEFAGDTYVTAGNLSLTGAEVGKTLHLAGGVNAQFDGNSTATKDFDLELEGTSQIHANRNSDTTLAGKVSGASATYDSRGAGVVHFKGGVELGAFTQTNNDTQVHFDSATKIGTLTVGKGNVYINAAAEVDSLVQTGTHVNLSQGSSLKVGELTTFTAGKGQSKATLGTTASGEAYSLGSASYKLTNGHLSVASDTETEVNNLLDNSGIENAGSGKLTVNNAANELAGAYASAGDLSVLQAAAGLNLNELVVGDTCELAAYTGTEQVEAQEADITVRGAARFGSGAKLNANLTLASGSTLSVAEGGVALGSTLSLQKGLTLDDATMERVSKLSVGGSQVLFTGVDSLRLATSDTEYQEVSDADSSILASTYFKNIGSNYQLTYTMGENAADGATLSITMAAVPEPTTTTLSLLALAALAARRRRK